MYAVCFVVIELTVNLFFTGILEYGSIKLQNASETIKGTYRLGLNGNWTEPIQYFADRSQVSILGTRNSLILHVYLSLALVDSL